jgi:hypothetical protein
MVLPNMAARILRNFWLQYGCSRGFLLFRARFVAPVRVPPGPQLSNRKNRCVFLQRLSSEAESPETWITLSNEAWTEPAMASC